MIFNYLLAALVISSPVLLIGGIIWLAWHSTKQKQRKAHDQWQQMSPDQRKQKKIHDLLNAKNWVTLLIPLAIYKSFAQYFGGLNAFLIGLACAVVLRLIFEFFIAPRMRREDN